MAIDLAEVGASCAVDPSGVLQIKFGLYLPGIRKSDGFGVVVRVIHDADRFDPGVPPVDVGMEWVAGSELDLWTATATLSPISNSHYGQDGLYLYRFQLFWTPVSGAKQLITKWFPDPFAHETDLGMLSAVTCARQAALPFNWADGAWRTPELDSLVVYEAQIEQFNDTFSGVVDRLVYLKSLGVNCLELMPVTSTKLDFDWGYGNRSLFYRMQPLLVALYTCQGVPMLWEGEEFVDDYQLPSAGAARINLRRDVHSEYFYDDYGSPVIQLCRILGALRAANPALRSRQSYYYYEQSLIGNAIVAYHRHAPAGAAAEQYAMVVINFGQATGQISLPFPTAGTWTDMVDAKDRATVGAAPLSVTIPNAGSVATVTVPSNYGYVFLT